MMPATCPPPAVSTGLGLSSGVRDVDTSTPWAKAFAEEVSHLRSRGVSYQDSAIFLRGLVKNQKLKFTDITNDPAKFFLAHRLLASLAPAHGPGFWIRFTVQFNLFAGTVVALGGVKHLAQLTQIQKNGKYFHLSHPHSMNAHTRLTLSFLSLRRARLFLSHRTTRGG